MSSFVVAGAALTAAGLAGRMLLRQASKVSHYRGGFEPKMTRREANLILNLSTSSSVDKVKQAHKRIIILNHPDKGGSPYLAAKINEAKSVLTKEPRQISFNSNVHDRIHRYLKKSVHILHNYLLLSEYRRYKYPYTL